MVPYISNWDLASLPGNSGIFIDFLRRQMGFVQSTRVNWDFCWFPIYATGIWPVYRVHSDCLWFPI